MKAQEPTYGLQHARKYCRCCRQVKFIGEFYSAPAKRRGDGLSVMCKVCTRAAAREQQRVRGVAA